MTTPPYILTLGGLHLTFYGLSDPHATGAWDQGWCQMMTVCEADGARVKVSGSLLHLVDMKELLVCLDALLLQTTATKTWDTLESHLSLDFEKTHLGHLTVKISLTPDPLTQQHMFLFELDQTYLTRLRDDLVQLLKAFDIKENHP